MCNLKSITFLSLLVITSLPSYGEDSDSLSDETKQLLCNISAGMTYEATRMRDEGITAEETESTLEKIFLKNKNATIKQFLSFAVDHAYKLKEFNEVTNYTLWLSACSIQFVKQNRDRIDFKYDYIDMVKEKIMSCENETQPKKQIDKCVLNIIMPALRNS